MHLTQAIERWPARKCPWLAVTALVVVGIALFYGICERAGRHWQSGLKDVEAVDRFISAKTLIVAHV